MPEKKISPLSIHPAVEHVSEGAWHVQMADQIHSVAVYRYDKDLAEMDARKQQGSLRVEKGARVRWWRCEMHESFDPNTRHWCAHVDAVRAVTA